MKNFCFLLLLLPTVALSHPVTYKGGWIYQGSFTTLKNDFTLGYSQSSKFAYTANNHYLKGLLGYQDYTLGMNYLFKRWLAFDSQANLYGGVQAGYYYDDISEGSVGHGFLMFDWESREYYTMAKLHAFTYDNKEIFEETFRLGFAPFVAGMNELQSWFIVQLKYNRDIKRELVITPMLRFFYHNVLWEMGSSTRGETFLTLMVHY